mgnify:CR=1 FL=1
MSKPKVPYRTVTLTLSQCDLLLSLLYEHKQDGSYWGSKKQHYALIEATRKVLRGEN